MHLNYFTFAFGVAFFYLNSRIHVDDSRKWGQGKPLLFCQNVQTDSLDKNPHRITRKDTHEDPIKNGHLARQRRFDHVMFHIKQSPKS